VIQYEQLLTVIRLTVKLFLTVCLSAADCRFCLVPEHFAPPVLTSETSTSVLVVFSAPQIPNGKLKFYTVQRNDYDSAKNPSDYEVGAKVFDPIPAGAELHLLDSSPELMPFANYVYRVGVTNDAGTTYSTWSTVRTKSSRKQ